MKKKNATTWWIVAVVIVAVGLIFASKYWKQESAAGVATKLSNAETGTSTVSGYNDSTAPWPAEVAHLKDRLAADGLALLAMEGNALHIHQHLDLFVHGTQVQVPAGIGIILGPGGSELFSPLHVHDLSNIIHIEAPKVETFTLGEFFDVWGVRFTNSCVGGYCIDEANALHVYVNGKAYQGDLRALPLAPHQEIVITYGTATETPKTIPSSYTFPAGY